MTSSKPLIALTAGDPAGIGPELCLQMAMDTHITHACRIVLVGNAHVFHRVAAQTGIADEAVPPTLELHGILDQMPAGPVIIDPTSINGESIMPGHISPAGGQAAHEALDWAITRTLAGTFHALVTAPLNKAALHLAGIDEPGHTEILARRCQVDNYAMLYWSHDLAVALTTIHTPLMKVAAQLSADTIARTALLTIDTLTRIHKRAPRLAVLGLNPHSGEDGLFGREEDDLIRPAIASLLQKGHAIDGPVPADTAFTPAALEKYDGIIAMYHDQGSIPFKMLHFQDGVNHTMGLPIIRTSVDHGTAFDIAWQGRASAASLKAAIEMALLLIE